MIERGRNHSRQERRIEKFTSRGRRIDRKEGSNLDGKGSRGAIVFLEEVISEESFFLESVRGNVESPIGGATGMMRGAALGILSLITFTLFEK